MKTLYLNTDSNRSISTHLLKSKMHSHRLLNEDRLNWGWIGKPQMSYGQYPPKDSKQDRSEQKRPVKQDDTNSNLSLKGSIKHEKIVGKITKPRKGRMKKDKDSNQIELDDKLRGGPSVRDFLDQLLEEKLNSKFESLTQVKSNQLTCGDCLCKRVSRINLMRILRPTWMSRFNISLQHAFDILQWILSLLSLIFLVGVVATFFICSRPRKLSFLQRILQTIYMILTGKHLFSQTMC